MVYEDNNSNSSELAYDLRQVFAVIVGRILDKIEMAREDKNFPEWFKQLDNLFIEINMKLIAKERIMYNNLYEETINEINKYSNVYRNLNNNSAEVEKLYLAIRKLNLWLGEMMEKHRLYGSRMSDDDGL